MLVFGYSFKENPISFVEQDIKLLKFSDAKKVTETDDVVIFGVGYNGDDTFSLDNIALICEQAKNVIYISSSLVYATKFLLPHKENDILASNSIEGTLDEVLEELILSVTFDWNRNSCVLRVDTIEDSSLLNIIHARSERGLRASPFSRISVISLTRLFVIIEKIFNNIEEHTYQIYNIADRNLSEFSYYSQVSFLPVGLKFKLGNSSLNCKKAERAGLL